MHNAPTTITIITFFTFLLPEAVGVCVRTRSPLRGSAQIPTLPGACAPGSLRIRRFAARPAANLLFFPTQFHKRRFSRTLVSGDVGSENWGNRARLPHPFPSPQVRNDEVISGS